MAKKERADQLLVARGLAESRTRAQALILAGEVVAGDQRVDKPGQLLDPALPLRLKGDGLKYVSRGALKLETALDHFALEVAGLSCVDIGASTGGFTDLLLQRGAASVTAVDVGYGQLADKLRKDPRVRVFERVNARAVTLAELQAAPFDLAVIDVSFISLTLILPAVKDLLTSAGGLVALVKPQFEAGPEHVGKGGVVRDEAVRQGTIDKVRAACEALSLTVKGVVDAKIEGPKGNREALLWAAKG